MKRKIVKAILGFLMKIVYRVKIIGEENIPDGGCIICPNHIHALDTVAIVTCSKHKIIFMAKKELFKNTFVAWLGKVFEVFPVNREGNDIEAIKHSLRTLKKEEILGIYPEGTRNGMAKGKKPKNGAVLIAIKAGKPIIPVGVQGNFKPFRKVKVIYGKPIYYKKDEIDLQNKQIVDDLTKVVMNEVVTLTNSQN